MDWFVFNAFLLAVKEQKQTPIDVYDLVTPSVITPLPTRSLKEGNAPQEFPDFTRDKWKTRKNDFALGIVVCKRLTKRVRFFASSSMARQKDDREN